MAQTLTSLLVHIVFSTKDRQDLIDTNIEPRLYSYLGGIARKMESRLLDAGGTANHVHLLISQSKKIALATLLEELKKSSSIWIKQQDREYSKFKWQDGYGGFSVGTLQVPQIKAYLAKQKEHHRKTTFQEEFIDFLNRYEIEYKEEYLWQ